jgi:hypothetical protein
MHAEQPRGLPQTGAIVVAIVAVFLAFATFLADEATTAAITEETQAADINGRIEANQTRTTVARGNVTLLEVIGEASARETQAAREAETIDDRIVAEYRPIDRELDREIARDEDQRDTADVEDHLEELAEVALQIAIVLAGVAIIARRRWLLHGGVGVAGAGVVLLIAGVAT